jgi:hypothetical protein
MMLNARPEHEVLYQELAALVNKYADKISRAEILAVAANMVGKIIALQDQRTMTREMALEIVIKNVEAGNQQIMEHVSNSKGSA